MPQVRGNSYFRRTTHPRTMNFPAELKYTKDHEWIRIEGDEAVVGITEFAQSELGDIVFVDINTVGQDVDHEAVFGTVEAVKTVSDLFMPVGGSVLAVNEALADDPAAVNKDPYGAGWMVRIKPANMADLDGLLDAAAYTALIGH